MEKPRVKELVAATGISKSYASDILAGKQPPSPPLAIHIFQTTGWRHALLDSLSDSEIEVAAKLHPWRRAA